MNAVCTHLCVFLTNVYNRLSFQHIKVLNGARLLLLHIVFSILFSVFNSMFLVNCIFIFMYIKFDIIDCFMCCLFISSFSVALDRQIYKM